MNYITMKEGGKNGRKSPFNLFFPLKGINTAL